MFDFLAARQGQEKIAMFNTIIFYDIMTLIFMTCLTCLVLVNVVNVLILVFSTPAGALYMHVI